MISSRCVVRWVYRFTGTVIHEPLLYLGGFLTGEKEAPLVVEDSVC